jgi:hypothetical protein
VTGEAVAFGDLEGQLPSRRDIRRLFCAALRDRKKKRAADDKSNNQAGKQGAATVRYS